ncbi:hypothetical protein ATANTOWER_021720 [Ataeniobius toweri]|uniref:Uncharacterized protein n=1 Tax=Ataeniobius toweri TaxID=208326 RepID=A0ABU7A9J7_9TELE|nr:hypothetical protein [Ataeniobius toweri]
MLLKYFQIMFFSHNVICFVKCTSPPCNTDNMKLPVGIVFLGVQVFSLSSKRNNDQCSYTHMFQFHQTTGHAPKNQGLCPDCICKQHSGFYAACGVMTSSLLSSLSAHVGIGLVSLWIMTSFSASTRSFVFVLGSNKTNKNKKRHIHLWETECPKRYYG